MKKTNKIIKDNKINENSVKTIMFLTLRLTRILVSN